jgi:hypothetical protein
LGKYLILQTLRKCQHKMRFFYLYQSVRMPDGH